LNESRIEKLKNKAKCEDCLRNEYCNRIPVNDLIVEAIKKKGKCPDFTTTSPLPFSVLELDFSSTKKTFSIIFFS